MQLTHITIKDFRSFSGEHSFDVAGGVNYFVGPNNFGKSNLIRALAIALDSDARYVPDRDRPFREGQVGKPPKSRITLRFTVGSSGPERTLLRRAEAYEQKARASRMGGANGGSTYASADEIHMVTTFGTQGARQTTFAAKGMGSVSLPATSEEHRKLEEQFRQLVRFAVIHSGEDLESLLQGKFREILQLVIEDHLSAEMRRASEAREQYLSALQTELLDPLRSQIEERVGQLFPEISAAELVPDVPTLDQTLSSVEVRLGDAVTTQLSEKGTGVRGAVLVSMLQYLAEQSRRSLVLAVEEPEAFLHPRAQEDIRAHLDDLATRSDVSLLITTHSPYVISRQPESLVTELGKRSGTGTFRVATASGADDWSELLGSLYRDGGLAQVIERSLSLPPDTTYVVVTEGYLDGHFITLGCRAAGRSDLLEGVHFLPAHRAANVVPQAILAQSATNLPVIALLDRDEAGRSAANYLKKFGWTANRDFLMLTKTFECGHDNHDVEVEDLLPRAAMERSIEHLGEAAAIDGKDQCKGTWRYRPSKQWKDWAATEFASFMPSGDNELMEVAQSLRDRADLVTGRRKRARPRTGGE